MHARHNAHIFRFTYLRRGDSWTIQDTLTGEISGAYRSEDDAVHAALQATASLTAQPRRPGGETLNLL